MSTELSVRNLQMQSWANDLRDQKASGLTVAQWCQQHNLSKNTFNYRVKALKKAAVSSLSPRIVEITPHPAPEVSSSSEGDITLTINDVTARIHSADLDTVIASIVKAARNA